MMKYPHRVKKENVTDIIYRNSVNSVMKIEVVHCYEIGERVKELVQWLIEKIVVIIIILVIVIAGKVIAL
jgi:hypothetical protein